MKQKLYILVFTLLLSCNSKTKYKKPENLIPKDQMVDLLFDMHIANGASHIKNINLEKNKNYMALVYEKYKIDSTRFAASNIYYTSNVEEYEEIFKEVQDRLKVLQKKYEKIQDSIYKIKNDSILNRYKSKKNKFKDIDKQIKKLQKEYKIDGDSILQVARDSSNIHVKKNKDLDDKKDKVLH